MLLRHSCFYDMVITISLRDRIKIWSLHDFFQSPLEFKVTPKVWTKNFWGFFMRKKLMRSRH